MRSFFKALGFLLLALPLAAAAAETAKPAPSTSSGQAPAEGIAGRQAWGDKLPEVLVLSLWNSKDGEAKAVRITTSREVFAVSFEMGKSDKEGLKAAVAGRILPRGDGSYELLLYVDVAGADSSKGGMGLKMQTSLVLKKGTTGVAAGNQDGQLMVRVD